MIGVGRFFAFGIFTTAFAAGTIHPFLFAHFSRVFFA
jgi:hypothetical protein